MSRAERAQHYFERLASASNPKVELQRIFDDLNGLVYSKSNDPISNAEKLRIIEELERLIKGSTTRIDERFGIEHFEKSAPTASDNSDVLDLISAMKRKVDK
ncbi:hypothetical protein AB6C82_24515 [Vibrio splendidus]